jgi:hypothetical protein
MDFEPEAILEQLAQHRLEHGHRIEDDPRSDLRAHIEAFGCRPRWRVDDLISLNAKRHPEQGCWRLVPCQDAVGPPAQPADADGIGPVRLD